MTKLFMSEFIIAYQLEMSEMVRQVVKEKFIAGVKSSGHAEPAWIPANLLPPPKVERLDLDFYSGGVNDIIWIYTSDDFGIVNLYLTFTDENGHLIERGNASEWPDEPNRWGYLSTVPVPEGTSVTVHVSAIDGFGGMSARSERITVTEPIWRRRRDKNS